MKHILSLSVLACALFLNACQSPIHQTLPVAQTASLPMQFEVNGQTMDPEQLTEFLIQSNQQTLFQKLAKKLVQHIKPDIWQNLRTNFKRSPELLIQDVILTDTGESIMGAAAPASIQPDYAGQNIRLTLTGVFKDKRKDLQQKSFLFTLDPELVQQTFLVHEQKKPVSRVLLNHAILLPTESVSGNQIQVSLNTKHLADLYLRGLHHLSVEHDNYYTDTLIQVGEPVPTGPLGPRIDAVEVLKDKQGKPMQIWLRGQNFMTYPKLSYATIDGEFGFGHQTEVLADGSFETTVHLPNPKTFDLNQPHVIIYATPFGVAFQEF